MDERETKIDQFIISTDSSSSYKCLSFSPSLNYLCCFGVFVFNETYFPRDTIDVRYLSLVCYAFVLHILR